MMSSKTDFSAKRVIDTVLNLLCEVRIQREIDEPIDTVKQNFNVTVSEPITHSNFNQVIAAFVRHVYRKGLRLPRQLSDQGALAEAIWLLKNFYQSKNTKGYEGALMDANKYGQAGLEFVLIELAESIKTVEKGKYIQWVFTVNFENLDWRLRSRIAAAFIEQNKEMLTGHRLDIDPARLADSLQYLTENQLAVGNFVRQIFRTERALAPYLP